MGSDPEKTLAFCLFKYFPHGGLQRDMLRIALACRQRGYPIAVYTTAWEGAAPDGLEVHTHRSAGWTNHGRMRRYHAWLAGQLARRHVACVMGFNKMPDLDIYYAADGCLAAKLRQRRSPLDRLMPRYRQYLAFEEAVFGSGSKTHILMLSKIQKSLYVQHYGTPENRMHFLPPNVARDRLAGPDASDVRQAFRRDAGLGDTDRLLLQLGSGFRTKGLDRSIRALACLPDGLLSRTQLHVVGDDAKSRYVRLAKRLGVADRVAFLGARDDVPTILLGADLLIHPAYHENTGTVLLEALASGLPVVASAVCGYAHYIEQAQAGWVIPEPFEQDLFNRTVRDALEDDKLRDRGRRGTEFAKTEDLYGMVEAAVRIIEHVAGPPTT
jgi:UDP-glucose:(heptosyl)LPS alpha-1,3-glucosyltransferase